MQQNKIGLKKLDCQGELYQGLGQILTQNFEVGMQTKLKKLKRIQTRTLLKKVNETHWFY